MFRVRGRSVPGSGLHRAGVLTGCKPPKAEGNRSCWDHIGDRFFGWMIQKQNIRSFAETRCNERTAEGVPQDASGRGSPAACSMAEERLQQPDIAGPIGRGSPLGSVSRHSVGKHQFATAARPD
jgi:hypothetical protein